MSRILVTVTYEYRLTDDIEDREEIYGTTDSEECVKIDLEYVEDLPEIADIVNTSYEIIEENNG